MSGLDYTVEELAREMYTVRVTNRALGPSWDQIGSVTKSVWLEYAAAVMPTGGEEEQLW